MQKHSDESLLQTYLSRNNGLNLKQINPSLEFIECEHIFRGGRIDIWAKEKSKFVGLELKSKDYQTRNICAQLLNYLNYLETWNGELYFIAPKIKYGIYSTLKTYYDDNKLKFFEYTISNQSYNFTEIKPTEIKDYRPNVLQTYHPGESNYLYNEKIIKGVSLIVKDKKQAKLITNILDDRKSREKQLEDVTDSVIDIVSVRNNKFIKIAYELLKLL
jgi:hypothetical protein